MPCFRFITLKNLYRIFLAGSVFLSLKFQNEYYKSTLGNRPRNYDCYCKRKLVLMKLFSFDGKEKVNQRVHLCYIPAPGHCPAPYYGILLYIGISLVLFSKYWGNCHPAWCLVDPIVIAPIPFRRLSRPVFTGSIGRSRKQLYCVSTKILFWK